MRSMIGRKTAAVELDRSDARLWKNGSKSEIQPTMADDVSGCQDMSLEAVE